MIRAWSGNSSPSELQSRLPPSVGASHLLAPGPRCTPVSGVKILGVVRHVQRAEPGEHVDRHGVGTGLTGVVPCFCQSTPSVARSRVGSPRRTAWCSPSRRRSRRPVVDGDDPDSAKAQTRMFFADTCKVYEPPAPPQAESRTARRATGRPRRRWAFWLPQQAYRSLSGLFWAS